jgi:hypothetical protein
MKERIQSKPLANRKVTQNARQIGSGFEMNQIECEYISNSVDRAQWAILREGVPRFWLCDEGSRGN